MSQFDHIQKTGQKCEACMYFIKNTNDFNGMGNCHRYPPDQILMNTPSGPATISQFPTIRANSVGCGEYLTADKD